jgi:hypothetical protein
VEAPTDNATACDYVVPAACANVTAVGDMSIVVLPNNRTISDLAFPVSIAAAGATRRALHPALTGALHCRFAARPPRQLPSEACYCHPEQQRSIACYNESSVFTPTIDYLCQLRPPISGLDCTSVS